MANLRVYELAKQYGVDNKVVKKILTDNGVEVKSHMRSITEEDAENVKKAMDKKPAEKKKEEAQK